MTEDEARRQLPDLQKPLGFCPAINNTCRTDCVRYRPARAIRSMGNNTGKGGWYILNPYCDNWTYTIES